MVMPRFKPRQLQAGVAICTSSGKSENEITCSFVVVHSSFVVLHCKRCSDGGGGG
jgi:hypothetical protein